jgi:antirestriction protein
MGQEPARVLLGTGARQHLRACIVALVTVSSIRETFSGPYRRKPATRKVDNMNTIETTTTPRAWVGCLGCYNNGRLTGEWLDAEGAQDLTGAGLTNDDGRCVRCNAEEFWCLDVEGLAKCEEMSPSTFVERAEEAQAINEHEDADALRAFLDNEGRTGTADDIEEFEDRYAGDFGSVEEYADEMLEGCGLLEEVPHALRYYIDTAKFGRDMELGGDIDTVHHAFGVYVFRTS